MIEAGTGDPQYADILAGRLAVIADHPELHAALGSLEGTNVGDRFTQLVSDGVQRDDGDIHLLLARQFVPDNPYYDQYFPYSDRHRQPIIDRVRAATGHMFYEQPPLTDADLQDLTTITGIDLTVSFPSAILDFGLAQERVPSVTQLSWLARDEVVIERHGIHLPVRERALPDADYYIDRTLNIYKGGKPAGSMRFEESVAGDTRQNTETKVTRLVANPKSPRIFNHRVQSTVSERVYLHPLSPHLAAA